MLSGVDFRYGVQVPADAAVDLEARAGGPFAQAVDVAREKLAGGLLALPDDSPDVAICATVARIGRSS